MTVFRLGLLFLCVFSGTSAVQWARLPDLEHYLPASGFLARQTTRSKAECGVVCSQMSDCVSFFFVSNNNTCQIHSSVYMEYPSDDDTQSTPSTSYYVDQAVTSTFSAPSTTSALSSVTSTLPEPTTTAVSITTSHVNACPSSLSLLPMYTTVELSTETFAFHVFTSTTTWDSARDACLAGHARLVVLRTAEKMLRLVSIVQNCGFEAEEGFWVDVTNIDAVDKTSPDAWVASFDNTSVPMTTDVWGLGYPNHPDIQNCARMRRLAGFLLDDAQCTNLFGFICEKN